MKCRTEIITEMVLQQPLLQKENNSLINQGPKNNEKFSIVSFESNTTLSKRKCKFLIFEKMTVSTKIDKFR